jgi:hypothetical protein
MQVRKAALLSVLAFVLALVPSRHSQAVFPIPVIAGIELVFSSGTMAAAYTTAIAAVAAGASLYNIKFKDSGGATAINLRVNPKAPQTVPAGWSAGANPGDPPLPPATSTPSGKSCVFSGGYSGTHSGADTTACFAAMVATLPTGPFGCHASSSVVYTKTGETSTAFNVFADYSPNPDCVDGVVSVAAVSNICPAGYTLSGSTCNLSNAAIVVKPSDNVAEVDSTGSIHNPETVDPDSSPAPGNVDIDGTGKVIEVTDAGGTKRSRVVHETDGGLTIETWTGRGDGTSDYERLTFAPTNGSSPTGGREATGGKKERVVGEGTGTGTSNTPATSGGQGMVCPGCATEATLSGVKSDTAAIRESLSTSGISSDSINLTAGKAALDAAAIARGEAMTSVTSVSELGLGLSITWPTSTCSNPSVDLPRGHGTLSVDMCARRADIQSILKWMLSIVTSVVLFGIGVGAVKKD